MQRTRIQWLICMDVTTESSRFPLDSLSPSDWMEIGGGPSLHGALEISHSPKAWREKGATRVNHSLARNNSQSICRNFDSSELSVQ